MSDYDAIDYVPIIGDIYRYAKIGYKIGSWLGNWFFCNLVEEDMF